jgi:hypothetical protein
VAGSDASISFEGGRLDAAIVASLQLLAAADRDMVARKRQ